MHGGNRNRSYTPRPPQSACHSLVPIKSWVQKMMPKWCILQNSCTFVPETEPIKNNYTMKQILSIIILALMACARPAVANDGVYFTSGNFLIPIVETDISAAREILTITIGKDSFATVDVYYEFQNNGAPKTVKMAFEAQSQYNDGTPLNRKGVHPFICDFTVNMNGTPLSYQNGVVAFTRQNDELVSDHKRLDLTKWKVFNEVPDTVYMSDDALYNPELDSIVTYGYAYYFEAPFKSGLNVVHHTYRYRMSFSVDKKFSIPYWLTPVTRWANHQVDDFTLCIKTEAPTELCITDSVFRAAPFVSSAGTEIYHLQSPYDQTEAFATLFPEDSITWHCQNFRPTADMAIYSPSWGMDSKVRQYQMSGQVVIDAKGNKYRYLADCGDSYFVSVQDYCLVKKQGCRIVPYMAEKGQGWLTINTDNAQCVNVRQRPTSKSKVICTICANEGELLECYPCLGLVTNAANGYLWFKVKVNGKTGYVRQDLMTWDALCTH